MFETEKMPKRQEKSRRRRRKFSLMDIVVYICASVLVIGAIYYFIGHREQEQDGVAARSKSKPPGPKIKNDKTSTVTGKDLTKDKIKEEGNKKQNSIEPKVNGSKLKEKDKEKEKEKNQEKDKDKGKNQDKEKEKDQEEEKKKDNETQEPIKDKEPVKLTDNEPINTSNNSGDNSNNSCDNRNNNSVNDGSRNSNGEVKDKEDELKPENSENSENSESDDVNTDHLNDDGKEQDQSTETEVLKEENSDNDPISVVEESKYPLFDVIKDGNMELFEKAIKNIDLKTEVNEDGLNALHYAASLMKIDIMRFIIENRHLSVKEVVKGGGYAGNTALHWACLAAEKYPEHAIEAVELLLKHGAKLDARDTNGYTPIFCAIQSGHLKLVEHLLAKDEKLIKTIREKDGNTLLHYAMGPCNSRPIMKLLIDKGAEVHAVNYYNREPIHEAAAMGCVDGLKELILTRRISKQTKSPSKSANKCKERFEKRCLYGASPLHFAAFYKKLEAVKFLFLIQSAFKAQDEKGKIAAFYAEKSDSQELKDYFEDRLKFEQELAECYKFVLDVEAKVRDTEDPLCKDAEKKYQSYLRIYLHEPRQRKKY